MRHVGNNWERLFFLQLQTQEERGAPRERRRKQKQTDFLSTYGAARGEEDGLVVSSGADILAAFQIIHHEMARLYLLGHVGRCKNSDGFKPLSVIRNKENKDVTISVGQQLDTETK